MAPAPWDSIPPQDTLFVLVTGANSGIGFGIGERLIDEFLTTRPLTSHLVLIPTTRSEKKSALTIASLREHAKTFATTSKALRSRVGPSYNARDTTKRVHILSVQVDLCQFTSIREAANQLINATLTSRSQDDDFESLEEVKIPRLDAVIFNAGIGGWYGLNWPKLFHNILTKGLIQATTYPTFKGSLGGHLIKPLANTKSKAANEIMGEVFCANIFGHYMFAHSLVPLLQRTSEAAKTVNPGRIIWESSVEPIWKNFSLDDFQAIKNPAAYESSKRLTDILAITASLPACQPFVKDFLSVAPTSVKEKDTIVPPKQYLAHPGIVSTTIFPLGAFLFFWYKVVLYLVRWLGSPWHCVTSYNGALSPVWLALEQQEALDAAKAERSKWGSAINRMGRQRAKKDEVEGWGWDGNVEPPSVTRRITGRRPDAVDLTKEKRIEFEALGAECWKEMEWLRKEWESRLNEL